MEYWQTSRRKISLDRPLVMGILNVTPDSFSDGGEYLSVDDTIRKAEEMVAEGADILDIGGESTRPGSRSVDTDEEIKRVVPAIEAISRRFDTPISIDTTKSVVAENAIKAGAEIINDISGLRFDERIAEVAASNQVGLVLMHSRGTFAMLHEQQPVDDIFADVSADFERALGIARSFGVKEERIVFDIGVGFGKTPEQNLELIAKLDKLVNEFPEYPILVGASRKSFIGRILGDVPPSERLGGSLAAALIAIRNGAKIVRVHDVKETVAAIKVAMKLNVV
ncbi:MAG: dihydropteroate synthase [Chloracidobacterium sp.]|nr:dihydropteroate synthase [Chloracidobacterium sp.]